MKLLAVDPQGRIEGLSEDEHEALPKMVQQINEQLVSFYGSMGYQPPWIAYVSLIENKIVGGGAYKNLPYEGKVEIVYYTLAGQENKGHATATALALIDLAIQTDEELTIVAQTLPETNASNYLLQKLGFTFFDVVDHPEEGPVWEWHLF